MNKKIHSGNGHIFGIEIVSQREKALVVKDRKELTIKQAHSILGHVNRHQTTKRKWLDNQRPK